MTVIHVEYSLSDAGLLPSQLSACRAGDPIEVVMTRLDVAPEAVRAAAALLSDEERHRASRFAFDCDRRRFTVARSRLRRMLGARLNVRPEAVELVYGHRGKPALSRRFAELNLQFNVAHCDDLAVFAFSSGAPVGVDLETVRPMRDADDLAAHFFSRGEYASYQSLARCDKPLAFFSCWTRKEALVKALGDGLFRPLDSFDVSLAPGEPAAILRFEDSSGDSCGWTLHDFSPGPGLVGAVVVGKRAEDFAALAYPERGALRPALFS